MRIVLVAITALELSVAPGCAVDGESPTERVGSAQHALTLNGATPGYVTTSSTDDEANRCAEEPEEDFDNDLIADPDYIVTYNSGVITECGNMTDIAPYIDDEFEEGELYHRQSIQRIYRDSENYLVVSQSVQDPPYAWRAGFEVVRMNAHDGPYDLGSAGVTPTSDFPGAPKCGDHIVNYFQFPEPPDMDFPEEMTHAGGLQVNGRYVAVPFEDPDDGDTAGFMTVDLDDPTAPAQGPIVSREDGVLEDAGNVALTKTNDEHFMVMVFGNDSSEVEVFVSAGTSMPTVASDWDSMDAFPCPFGPVVFGDCLAPAYQNVQFVTDCSGLLYVVATHKDGSGDDWADLWKVTFEDAMTYEPTFELIEPQRNMICSSSNTANERFCDFDAGAGPYVDPDGELILYGVEHFNDFPLDGSPANRGVKVREFPQP